MYKSRLMYILMLVSPLFGVTITQAATVSVIPPNTTVRVGDVFSVSIVGREFTTALDAGGLNVAFDANVIQVASDAELPAGADGRVSFDPIWNTDSQINVPAPRIGGDAINDILFFAESAPDGDFNIAQIWFRAVGVGQTTIALAESNLNPFAGGGGALAVELMHDNVVVEPIPIPAALWLMISGLVGIRAMSKKC